MAARSRSVRTAACASDPYALAIAPECMLACDFLLVIAPHWGEADPRGVHYLRAMPKGIEHLKLQWLARSGRLD